MDSLDVAKFLPAFQALADELQRLLITLQEISDSNNRTVSLRLTEEQFTHLDHAFHQLKGGAGFLKLHSLSELATNAENWTKSRAQDEQCREFLSELQQNLQRELSSLTSELKKSQPKN